MKFLHTSDWHLGRKLEGYDLIEDQDWVLTRMIDDAVAQNIDAVVIAGDVFDRPTPTVDARRLFDRLLVTLSRDHRLPVLVISGNHDHIQTVSTRASFLQEMGVHIPDQHGEPSLVVLEDDHGPIAFHLFPFVTPDQARKAFGDEDLKTYGDVIGAQIERAFELADPEVKRHVAVVHGALGGSTVSESERALIGGVEHLDRSLFTAYSYVALGHMHQAQTRGNANYPGSPLVYSKSELSVPKQATLVEIGEGEPVLTPLPLSPKRPTVKRRGAFQDLLDAAPNDPDNDAYVYVELTERSIVRSVHQELSALYPHLLSISYDLRDFGGDSPVSALNIEQAKSADPKQLAEAFLSDLTGKPLDEATDLLLEALVEEAREVVETSS